MKPCANFSADSFLEHKVNRQYKALARASLSARMATFSPLITSCRARRKSWWALARNSAGALVDTEGRLVGINTAIFTRTGGNQGVGFAIPSNLARDVMQSLREKGRVVRGYIGASVQTLTPELAEAMKLKGEATGALV